MGSCSICIETEAFDWTDYQFIQLLAAVVEVGLDRAVRVHRLESLQQITQAILGGTDHETVARLVLEELPANLDFPISGIWQYEPATSELQPLGFTDQAREIVGEPPTFSGDDSIAWQAFQRGETGGFSGTTSVTISRSSRGLPPVFTRRRRNRRSNELVGSSNDVWSWRKPPPTPATCGPSSVRATNCPS